jgi:hypothetical protein
MVKSLKSLVQSVYRNLNGKQMSSTETRRRFQGRFPVSPVVLYITMGECTLNNIG